MAAKPVLSKRRWSPEALRGRMGDNPGLGIISSSVDLLEATSDVWTKHQQKEYDFQLACFAEFDRMALADQNYLDIYPVPNGQYRAGQRPEAGMKAGVPDICIAVPRFPYHGAYLELKVGKNGTSKEQDEWQVRLSRQGYFCKVVKDSVEAVVNLVRWYMNQPEW